MRGKNKFNAWSVGGYWTHFGEEGGYVDGVIQGTYYRIHSSDQRGMLDPLKTNAFGLALSVEAGKPYRKENGWFIEPQAQAIAQIISVSSAHDGAHISFHNVDSLVGRVGARIGRTWTEEDGRMRTMWVRPNIWHEFRGDPITKFDGHAPFRADLGGTTGEINLGVSMQHRRDLTFHANASYYRQLSGRGHSYGGEVGLRYNF
jgi:outer membrane autotransporter protein